MVIENMCGEPLDLPFESLNNIDLIGYNFHRHFLKEISICNTNIIKCDFRNAKMVQVYMENTTIKDSILVMLDICDCSFVNCDFTGEYIAFCKFENVDFTGADFSKVLMKGNEFYNCNFSGANMNCSGMVDCKFVDSVYGSVTS